MDSIMDFIKEVLPNLINMEAIKDKLTELGTETVDDLSLLDFETDTNGLFKTIHARKLKNAVALKLKPAQPPPQLTNHFNQPPETVTTPVLPQIQSTPSTSFASSISLALYKIPYDKFSPSLKKKMAKKLMPTAGERSEMVRLICDEAYEVNHHPPREFYSRVAKEIVQTHPETFADLLEDGNLIGSGYFGLEQRLKDRIANLNSSRLRLERKKRKLADIEDEDDDETGTESSPLVKRKNSKKDQYGCVAFLPRLPDGETELSLETKKTWLQTEFLKEKNSRDVVKIKEFMSATYAVQRGTIAQGEAISLIRNEWPFLFEVPYLLDHFNTLMGFDLMERAATGIAATIPDTVAYLKAKSFANTDKGKAREPVTAQKLRKHLAGINPSATNNVQFVHVVMLLLDTWNQEEDIFLRKYVNEENIHDIEAKEGAPSHPHMAVMGDSCLKEGTICYAVVENNVIAEELSTNEVILIVFAMYFVFSMHYPQGLAAILEFIQRLILKISGDGSKVNRGKNKAAPPKVNPRVLTLQTALSEYKQMWID